MEKIIGNKTGTSKGKQGKGNNNSKNKSNKTATKNSNRTTTTTTTGSQAVHISVPINIYILCICGFYGFMGIKQIRLWLIHLAHMVLEWYTGMWGWGRYIDIYIRFILKFNEPIIINPSIISKKRKMSGSKKID